MKRLIIFFVSLVFVLCFVGCDNGNKNATDDNIIKTINENSVKDKMIDNYVDEYEIMKPQELTKEESCYFVIEIIQSRLMHSNKYDISGNETKNYSGYETKDLKKDIEFLYILKREIREGTISTKNNYFDNVDELLDTLEKIYYKR